MSVPMSLMHGLNDAQARAVAHTGPALIVLAGPGTGKTRVIERRVAHTVLDQGADASSMLAVTFTIKATAEMRRRISETMAAHSGQRGAALANRLQVMTFHALGMRLVARFGDLLGMPPRRGLIDDVQRTRLMSRIALQRGLFRSSLAEGLKTAIAWADGVSERLANHAVQPADALAAARTWLESAGRAAQSAEERDADIARAERFADAAALWEEYSRTTLQQGLLTFRDLLLLPIRLMKEHPSVAAIVRDEIRHVVVDEFQDMNRAQIVLLTLLAPPGGHARVCVVGDDDQSIYGFRGADDRAFETFAHAYAAHEVVRLEENYRSGGRIIAAANGVISMAHRRFDASKRVRQAVLTDDSGKPLAAPEAGSVEAIRLEKDAHAGGVIAAMILADRAANPRRTARDYAVVARTHAQLDRIGAALELEGVPISRGRQATLADDAGVRVAIAWARLIRNGDDLGALRDVLLNGPVSMPPDQVARIDYDWLTAKARRGAAGGDEPVEHEDALAFAITHDALNDRSKRALVAIVSLRAAAMSTPADEMIEKIIHTSEVADAELLDARARAARVAALVGLVKYARDRQGRLSPPADLATLLEEYGDDLLNARPEEGRLDADELLDEQASDDAAPAANGSSLGSGGVSLLTAHSAKGLEFDVVFVPGLHPQNRWPDTRGRDDQNDAEYPQGLLGPLATEDELAAAVIDEERRLFYVALTRAKRRAVVLAKTNKKRSMGVNFFEQLTLDEPCRDVVTTVEHADVAGMIAGETVGDSIETKKWSLDAAAGRSAFILKLRQQTRLRAAAALDAVDRADADPGAISAASAELAACAERLAAIAHIGATGTPPAWGAASGDRSFAANMRRIAERMKAATDDAAASVADIFGRGGASGTGLHPPLKLSFSKIDAYERCPACFYLRHVLRLEDAGQAEQAAGTVMHAALERFYRLWSDADAEGRFKPGLSELEKLIRTQFTLTLPAGRPLDDALLEKLLAQGRVFMQKLHDDNAHVLELEKAVEIPFEHNGVRHDLYAKLDRIDAIDDAQGQAYRIVDYKSGQAWKKHVEPAADDLQMGIYAMAVDALLGEGGQVRGVAEYWLLATGQRGVIGLDRLKRDKIKARIGKAIDGMLAGNWTPEADCDGECSRWLRGTPRANP